MEINQMFEQMSYPAMSPSVRKMISTLGPEDRVEINLISRRYEKATTDQLKLASMFVAGEAEGIVNPDKHDDVQNVAVNREDNRICIPLLHATKDEIIALSKNESPFAIVIGSDSEELCFLAEKVGVKLENIKEYMLKFAPAHTLN